MKPIHKIQQGNCSVGQILKKTEIVTQQDDGTDHVKLFLSIQRKMCSFNAIS